MAYNLTITETYKGGPTAREKYNFTSVMSPQTLGDVKDEVMRSINEIHARYDVLREWDEVKGNSIIKKVLFKRPGKQGRLIRTHRIERRKEFKIDDSLI